MRLGLDLSHLRAGQPAGPPAEISLLKPDLKYLRVAGPTMAATWFALRGCAVSFPAEPALYDLLADTPEGISRVQVKTSTSLTKDGWMVTVGRHPNADTKRGHLAAYDPESIDLFFVIDGDFAMYLIPSRALAGRVRVLIRAYTKYIVGNADGLLGSRRPDRDTHRPRREGHRREPERIGVARVVRIGGKGGGMADVGLWLDEVAGALDVTLEDVLPEATQDELLTLTGDIAHNVVRLAVPLSSYLIGVAVGRGASAEEAIRLVGELLPAADG